MFQIQWLRRAIRRYMKPVPEESAHVWKQRLSVAYMLLAWNAFGFVVYNVYKGKADWAEYHGLPKEQGTSAQQWTRTLGIKDATVYRISGMKVGKYEVHNEFDDKGNLIVTEATGDVE